MNNNSYLYQMYHQNKEPNDWWLLLAIVIFLAVVLFINIKVAGAEEVNLRIIAQIESSNNPNAIGKSGEIGLYQISPIALEEFNSWLISTNREPLTRRDLFNPVINKMIAETYFDYFIPHWLADYGKSDTISNKLIAWNAGMRAIEKGYVPKSTKEYIKKYKLLERIK